MNCNLVPERNQGVETITTGAVLKHNNNMKLLTLSNIAASSVTIPSDYRPDFTVTTVMVGYNGNTPITVMVQVYASGGLGAFKMTDSSNYTGILYGEISW